MIGNISDCTSDESLMVYKNGGSKTFTQIEPLNFLPMEVHFNPDSMSKILIVTIVFLRTLNPINGIKGKMKISNN